MYKRQRQGIEVEIVACGKKAIGYFSYRNIVPVFEFRDLSADPTYEEAAEISQFAGDGYREGKLDEVIIVFNHAKNAAEQRLIEQQVLPINTTSYADLLGLAPKEKDYFEHFREKDQMCIRDRRCPSSWRKRRCSLPAQSATAYIHLYGSRMGR